MAEIGIERNSQKGDDDHPTFVTAGVLQPMSETVDLDFGGGQGLDGPANDLALLLGVTVRI